MRLAGLILASVASASALDCAQFSGTCQAGSSSCDGSFRRGFCPGSSSCCVPAASMAKASPLEVMGTVNGAHGKVTVKHVRGNPLVVFASKLAVDADGANAAYNPENTGVDHLGNAGCSNNRGSCYGIGKTKSGQKAVQGSDQEYPGFYTSSTSIAWSFADGAVVKSDNFVNSLKVPYVVVPGGSTFRNSYGGRVSDLGLVYDPKTNYMVPVIAADSGPANKIGEGSIRLMEAFGHNVYDRNGRCNIGISASRGVKTLLFAGSGNGRPRTLTDLWSEVKALIEKTGGMNAIAGLLEARQTPVLMDLDKFCSARTFLPANILAKRNANFQAVAGRHCPGASPAEGGGGGQTISAVQGAPVAATAATTTASNGPTTVTPSTSFQDTNPAPASNPAPTSFGGLALSGEVQRIVDMFAGLIQQHT